MLFPCWCWWCLLTTFSKTAYEDTIGLCVRKLDDDSNLPSNSCCSRCFFLFQSSLLLSNRYHSFTYVSTIRFRFFLPVNSSFENPNKYRLAYTSARSTYLEYADSRMEVSASLPPQSIQIQMLVFVFVGIMHFLEFFWKGLQHQLS